jgi:hypothetical protein
MISLGHSLNLHRAIASRYAVQLQRLQHSIVDIHESAHTLVQSKIGVVLNSIVKHIDGLSSLSMLAESYGKSCSNVMIDTMVLSLGQLLG